MPARITGSASGSSTWSSRWRRAHAHAPRRLESPRAAPGSRPRQRVLEDRQEAIEEQREQRRRRRRSPAAAPRGPGPPPAEKSGRCWRGCATAAGIPHRRARDEDAERRRPPRCWRAPRRTRCCRCASVSDEQAALGVDRRRVVLGQRREDAARRSPAQRGRRRAARAPASRSDDRPDGLTRPPATRQHAHRA